MLKMYCYDAIVYASQTTATTLRGEMVEGCLYGRPLEFPVDTTLRASRRACLEPRFLVRLEGDAMLLKDEPIHFLWRPKSQGQEKVVDDDESVRRSPERNTAAEMPPWDPNCVGFGPILNKIKEIVIGVRN
jgi:hypothetical protein